MPFFTISFLCGIVLLQLFITLPPLNWAWPIIVVAALLRKFYWRYTKYLSFVLIGFVWCLWQAHAHFSQALPSDLEGKNLIVIGTITAIPDVQKQQTAFFFDLKKMAGHSAQGKLHLSWRACPSPLHAGETWELSVRLKKPHGTMNPDGFDYEAWAFKEGLIGTGYIVSKAPAHLIQKGIYHPIDYFRQYLNDKINANLTKSPTSHWINALALGERLEVTATDWQILRRTGTNHLMAIAGLHIGMMSAFIYAIFSWGWRLFPNLSLWAPAQEAGAVAALCAAIFYSLLAGFSLPTERACLMLAFILLAILLRRHVLRWWIFSLAALTILILDPLCVLTESFWLSFASVALIIYGLNGRLACQGLWWQHGRLQWALGLGLLPLSIGFFHQCSLVSFLANAIAVPWVGLMVLPLTMAGSLMLIISAPGAHAFLFLADHLLQILWAFLTYLAGLSWGTWSQSVSTIGPVLFGFLGSILLLAPSGFPGRGLGIICFLPLILYHSPKPAYGEVWFTLLDVGQGLSAVLQTARHIIVFDTGEKLNDQVDMGENVVLPFLQSIQANKIDLLVISHGDNDHMGGANALLKAFPVLQIKTSVPQKFLASNLEYCLSGDHWQWDGVQFDFLYPGLGQFGSGNDSSCVLRVTVNQQHILLTGDIEKKAERYLLNSKADDLSAAVLVAPHHGSKTSALDEFIDHVKPKTVLFPIGYRNRYHFPHPSVVAKYEARGAKMYDSARYGAIQYHLTEKGLFEGPFLYRVTHQKYWYNIC